MTLEEVAERLGRSPNTIKKNFKRTQETLAKQGVSLTKSGDDYNIQIIDKSTMPNVVNGNLVLASHNGASYISFFRNLDKLNINDKIYVYYGGYKYIYSLSKTYDTPKDGNIEVYRDNSKTTITLITCKKNSKDTQVVYIGYLDSKELY